MSSIRSWCRSKHHPFVLACSNKIPSLSGLTSVSKHILNLVVLQFQNAIHAILLHLQNTSLSALASFLSAVAAVLKVHLHPLLLQFQNTISVCSCFSSKMPSLSASIPNYHLHQLLLRFQNTISISSYSGSKIWSICSCCSSKTPSPSPSVLAAVPNYHLYQFLICSCWISIILYYNHLFLL